jgi:chromosome segregation ATPase
MVNTAERKVNNYKSALAQKCS